MVEISRTVPLLHSFDGRSGSNPTTKDNINKGQQNLACTVHRVPQDPFRHVVLTAVLNFLVFLLPTFISTGVRSSAVRRPLRKTAFLDGVRGIAAVMVTTYHHMNRTNYSYGRPYYLGPYGEGEDPQDFTSLAQLPIIRVFCSSGSGVAAFFVISGYLLSLRPVQIIRQVEREANPDKRYSLLGRLAETLFSSIIRRAVRLFLPCIAGILVFECMDAIGMFHFEHAAPGFWGYWLHFWYLLGTLFGAIWNIDGGKMEALRQLWTISTEFTCSMALFVVIIGISGLSTRRRVLCLTGLMGFASYYDHNGFFAFIGGIFLAEVEEIFADLRIKRDADIHRLRDKEHKVLWAAEKNDRSTRQDQRKQARRFTPERWTSAFVETNLSALYYIFWNSMLLVSLYVFGWPRLHLEREPVLSWADSVLGRERSRGFAAFAFVNCLFRLRWLRDVFTKPVPLYLGDISFSMYCVHYSFILAFEKRIARHVSGIFGAQRLGHANRFCANVYEAALMLCVVIWAGDLFLRLVDIPAIQLARWIERTCKVEHSSQNSKQ